MKKKEFERFEGFEFEVSPEQLLVDIEKMIVYDDGTAATGDVYDTDDDFNETMKAAEEEFFQIIKECK